MTWTYDDPSLDRKDEVRFLVGDTDEADKLVSDEEIEYILTQSPPATGVPAWMAGARVADGIASSFARKAQRSIGELSLSAQQQYEHYREVADRLRALALSNGTSTGTGTLGSVKPAGPVLGGGGPTYLWNV